MSLEFVNDLPALSSKLLSFMMTGAAALPDHTREALIEFAAHPSPVDRVVFSAEALFAVKDELEKDGRDIAAQLAQYAAVNGWHGMEARGVAIASALQRIGGYKAPANSAWPPASEDPEPLERFLPAAEPEPENRPAPEPSSA